MKVLEAFGEPISNGGQEAFVMNVLQRIDKNELQIDFLTPYYCDNEFYREIIKSYGGECFELHEAFVPGKQRFNIVKSVNIFLQQHKYDVIHIHSGSISILGIMAWLAKKNGIKKIIVHSHCSAECMTIKRHLLRVLFGKVMQHCVDEYCACSLSAGEAKFMPGITNGVLKLINNGIDLERFSFNTVTREQIRQQLGIAPDNFVIGHVGRFEFEKNHKFILAIFQEVLKMNDKALLMLIGDGILRDEILALAKQGGIAEKIKYLGRVNNVNAYMQAMDCFILPSLYEGLSIVSVEAQATGLPCVVSDTCPPALKLSERIKFLSLNTPPEAWAQAILENIASVDSRKSDNDAIKAYGYDIADTAAQVREMYFS